MTTTIQTANILPPADQQLMAEVARLKAENEELAAKKAAKEARKLAREARAKEDHEKLPTYVEYNPKTACTFEDISSLMHDVGLTEDPEDLLDARSFVRLFGLTPEGQYKPVPNVRGAGKHLFRLSEVERCILLVRSARV